MKPAATATLPFAACAMLLCAATHAGAADAAPVQKVTVRSVAYFDFAKASVRPQDQAAILAKVGKMKGVTWQTVTATGHTDSIGRADYNEKLSAERASAVKSYLVGKGLDPAMIIPPPRPRPPRSRPTTTPPAGRATAVPRSSSKACRPWRSDAPCAPQLVA